MWRSCSFHEIIWRQELLGEWKCCDGVSTLETETERIDKQIEGLPTKLPLIAYETLQLPLNWPRIVTVYEETKWPGMWLCVCGYLGVQTKRTTMGNPKCFFCGKNSIETYSTEDKQMFVRGWFSLSTFVAKKLKRDYFQKQSTKPTKAKTLSFVRWWFRLEEGEILANHYLDQNVERQKNHTEMMLERFAIIRYPHLCKLQEETKHKLEETGKENAYLQTEKQCFINKVEVLQNRLDPLGLAIERLEVEFQSSK